MNKAVFLDRDGVINSKAPAHDYIKSWEEFIFLPHVAEAIKYLSRKGFMVVVHSNQRGVARGLLTEGNLNEIHQKMVEELNKVGAKVDGVYYCPHDYSDHCECRKPKPGMLANAAKELGINLKNSYLIGDSQIDIEAGKAVGCKTILVLTGEVRNTSEVLGWSMQPDFITPNLSWLREIIK